MHPDKVTSAFRIKIDPRLMESTPCLSLGRWVCMYVYTDTHTHTHTHIYMQF